MNLKAKHKAEELTTWTKAMIDELEKIQTEANQYPWASKWDSPKAKPNEKEDSFDVASDATDVLETFINDEILVWNPSYNKEMAKPLILDIVMKLKAGHDFDGSADPVGVQKDIELILELDDLASFGSVLGNRYHGCAKAQLRVVHLLSHVCSQALRSLTTDGKVDVIAHVRLIHGCLIECQSCLPLKEKLQNAILGFFNDTLYELNDAHQEQSGREGR